MIWEVLGWAAITLALIGTILNARANKWSFVFWMVANAYNTFFNFFMYKNYPMSAFFFISLFLAIQGFIVFGKRDKREEELEAKAKATQND